MRPLLVFTSLALASVACSSTTDVASGTRADAGLGRDARTSSGGTPASGGGGAGGSGGAGGGAASGGTGAGGRTERDASVDAGSSSDARADGAADARGVQDASAGPASRLEWAVFYDHAYAAHVEADSSGAAVVSGTFFDAKDLTLGTTTLKSHGQADVMLSRVYPDGIVDWARGYGGTADDYPVSFILDPQDRIALVGLYNGSGNIGGPDFPPFTGTPGRFNVYAAALSATGDHLWSITVGTTADSFGGPGLSLALGDLIIPGYFTGTATIGGVDHASAGGQDAYVARYAPPSGTPGSTATLDNAFTLGAGGDDRAVAALYTGSGMRLVGQFQGTITLPTVGTPTTLTSQGGTDVFLAQVSVDGVFQSAVSFGGTGNDVVTSARLDGYDLVLAGAFDSPSLSILGGAPLSTAGGKDGFVARLDGSYQHVWSERLGGAGDDLVRDVAVGLGGAVAITGEFASRIQLGGDVWNAARAPSDAGPSGPDLFVAKLAANGTPVWSFATGGPLTERGLSVAVYATGAVYATVSFQSPVDFGDGKVLTPDSSRVASALLRFAP